MSSPIRSIKAPCIADAWRLAGPIGVELDTVAVAALLAGMNVETIEPGAYRITRADRSAATELARQLEGTALSLTIEQPPPSIGLTCRMISSPRTRGRATIMHTADYSAIARAIDHRLTVVPLGIGRVEVTGPSADQVRWLVDALHRPTEDVLALLGVTADQIDTEDVEAARPAVTVSVPVRVELPTRRTETKVIKRDDDGQIVEVQHIEADYEGDPK